MKEILNSNILLTLSIIFNIISASFSLAQNMSNLDISEIALTGFYNNDQLGAGYNAAFASQTSPAVADIDGNLQNGLEIAIVTDKADLIVMGSKGNVIWKAELPNKKCDSGSLLAGSSPAVGRLKSKDSIPTLVVGYGSFNKTCAGGVIAYNGATGKIIFDFNLKTYGKKQRKKGYGYTENLHSVISTPALADVNNDGKLEIAFGSWSRHVFLLNNKGNVLWYYQAGDTVWSSPAIADVVDDADLEVIAATDISKNIKIKPETPNGGIIYNFKSNINNKFKKNKDLLVSFRSSKALNWYKTADQTFFSSPVIADVMPNKAGKEVIIGSGYFFPIDATPKKGANIKIYNAAKGKLLTTIPVESCTSSSVAIADVNFDGINEIISIVNAYSKFGGDGKLHLSAWQISGNGQEFIQIWTTALSEQNGYNYFTSPIVADLDGNGSLEIIIPHHKRIRIFNAASGAELTEKGITPEFEAGKNLNSTVAVADLNQDGKLELIYPTIINGSDATIGGALVAVGNFNLWLNSEASQSINTKPYAIPWGQWRGDAQKRGDF